MQIIGLRRVGLMGCLVSVFELVKSEIFNCFPVCLFMYNIENRNGR